MQSSCSEIFIIRILILIQSKRQEADDSRKKEEELLEELRKVQKVEDRSKKEAEEAKCLQIKQVFANLFGHTVRHILNSKFNFLMIFLIFFAIIAFKLQSDTDSENCPARDLASIIVDKLFFFELIIIVS